MKITGILPVHNGEKFIDTSLSLILRNLNTDDELVIIENGSTDGTIKKLQKWVNIDSRINLISTETPSLVKALNLGIAESFNNWIARFDIDDTYEPDRLKYQRASLNEKTIAIFTDYDFFSDSYNYLGTIPSALDTNAVAVSLISSQRTAHPSVLFSKEAAINAGCYRDIDFPAEDLSLWLRMSRFGDLISIPKTLLHYRLSNGSITTKKRNEAKNISKKLLTDIGINQKNVLSLIANFESVIELYKKHDYARERELLILKDLYHLSKESRLESNLRKKVNKLLIQSIPKYAVNIPNLKTVKSLRKEQVLRNKVRRNLL